MAETPLDQLGLVDGNAFGAADLLKLTDASTQQGPTADRPTGSRRFDGKLFYDTTTKQLLMWNATAAAWLIVGQGTWTAYTPTWSGTLGNGTISGSYVRIGQTVSWELGIVWGSTTSHPAANQTITIPLQIASANALRPVGRASYALTGPSYVESGEVMFASGTVTCVLGRASTALFVSNIDPFTWATGSQLFASGSYRCA